MEITDKLNQQPTDPESLLSWLSLVGMLVIIALIVIMHFCPAVKMPIMHPLLVYCIVCAATLVLLPAHLALKAIRLFYPKITLTVMGLMLLLWFLASLDMTIIRLIDTVLWVSLALSGTSMVFTASAHAQMILNKERAS